MRATRYGAWWGAAMVGTLLAAMPAAGFDVEADLLKQEGEDPFGWVEDYTTYGDGKLTLSGSIRNRVESRSEFDFNDSVNRDFLDETWGLLRFRLKADLQAHENLRLVGELQSSHAYELDNNNSRTVRFGPGASQDRLDIFQAYAEVRNLADIPQLTLRGGRYALAYGNERLVGAFAWSNVGRSFQGVRAAWEEETWWLHAFYNDVVTPFDGHANNNDPNNNLSGVYVQYHGYDWGKTELYYLRHEQDDIGPGSIDGRETHSVGMRFEAKLLADKAVDVDGEVVYQDGKFTSALEHQAFALHLGGGYTFQNVAATPRVGAQYNFASGDDDPTDGENNTFDNLFPTNHLHYGYMDRFGWRNLHNAQLELSAKPYKSLLLKLDYHAFWLAEPSRAPWQNAGGGVIRPATAQADAFVGTELDLTAKWTFYKHWILQGGYSHFFTGDFVDDSGPDDDADWWYVQTVFTF